MKKTTAEKVNKAEYDVFEISVLIKGFDGLLEVIGGIILLLLNPARVDRITMLLTQHELSQDPHDLVANYLVNAASRLTPHSFVFGSFFLISHGIIKIALVWALLAKKLWAYPTAIAVFGGFGIYQLYRIYVMGPTHSFGLIFLTILDLVVIVLTAIEWRKLALARS